MKSLYLAWESPQPQRAWYPIGLLLADPAKPLYQFAYTKGAQKANKEVGLKPLDAFPDFKEFYESAELFPLFQNRILSPGRADFKEYIDQLALSPGEANPLEILAVSGGERQTDSLEVFPRIEKHKDGSFKCRFLLHGWRLLNPAAIDRALPLKEGDPLQVSVELNNPATTLAIQLQTRDYHVMGWTPRYLVRDLIKVLEDPAHITAKVVKVNPSPAPSRMRILVELEGRWPEGYEPMSSPEFQPIVKSLFSRWRSQKL